MALQQGDLALHRQRLDEGDGRLRQELQPRRLALPAGRVVVAEGGLDAGIAFAAQLEELADLERVLGAAGEAVLAIGEIVDLDAQGRVGQGARLLAPSVRHVDSAVCDRCQGANAGSDGAPGTITRAASV